MEVNKVAQRDRCRWWVESLEDGFVNLYFDKSHQAFFKTEDSGDYYDTIKHIFKPTREQLVQLREDITCALGE